MNDLLKEWVRIDDACEIQEDGTIESFHCIDNGQDELEFIIERLRSLYASGGAVSKIVIDDLNRNSGTLNNV
jgi:hypothetical protein|tara:strand:- start:635 stop:850 length:216 start_codon:yes stop_codon:yes gene_type:complete